MEEKRETGYKTTRGYSPLDFKGFKPSVKNCLKRKCKDLKIEEYGGVKRNVCGINGRIPGNLGECPKDLLKKQNGGK